MPPNGFDQLSLISYVLINIHEYAILIFGNSNQLAILPMSQL